MKRFIILGSTGSIGMSSLDVVNTNPDKFKVVGLCAHSSAEKICSQIQSFRPEAVSMTDPVAAGVVSACVGSKTKVYSGVEGMLEMIKNHDAEGVINGIVGSSGMLPTITALESGKDVLLANKETMVMAGKIVNETALKSGRRIIPIDSEMSAVYQCLKGETGKNVKRLILTASGGPFIDFSADDLMNVTLSQTLNHPTWNMGTKNTIDSATLMNKGLEVIEASFLFNMPGDKIDVVIHRSSIAHSFVEFIDGSILCQLSKPDMRLAIQYAMTDPQRERSFYGGLDFTKPFNLTFEPPDTERFPCLSIAYNALKTGGTAPAAMNAANETAVKAFENGRISFMDIPEIIKKAIDMHHYISEPTVEELIRTDSDAKSSVAEMTII